MASHNIVIRRKDLFYTVILVVPCMLISNMITAVFLIPPREHKMTFSILTFVALSVFYLVLIELIPPTSLVIPLIGKYLLFTLSMLCSAIFISVFNVNVYRRRQSTTYPMSRWKRWLFVETLPRYLHLKMLPDESGDVRRLSDDAQGSDIQPSSSNAHLIDGNSNQLDGTPAQFGCSRLRLLSLVEELQTKATNVQAGTHLALFRRMACNVALIGATFAKVELEGKVVNEWRLMSLVIDRLCLIAYLTLNIIATTMVILQSPALFDQRRALSRTIASRPLSGDTASMFP